MHGANATGRAFTGDASGKLLFETLYKFGFANKASSVSLDDGMRLKSCRITNAVKCLPPKNKPSNEEIGDKRLNPCRLARLFSHSVLLRIRPLLKRSIYLK